MDHEHEANPEFSPTQWSVVLRARSDSADRKGALESLFTTYWPPLYGYLRRRGHSPQDAEDLAQGFFVYLMESDFLDRTDPSKGRFRGYLIGALKRFLSTHHERQSALKRGGNVQFASWTSDGLEDRFAELEHPQLDPSEAFEKNWALTLLGQCLQRLEREQVEVGKQKQFTVLKPFLSAAPTPGEYDTAARTLGTSRTTVAVWVHRLNIRYGEIVRMEVASTVDDPAGIKEEMQHLFQALTL